MICDLSAHPYHSKCEKPWENVTCGGLVQGSVTNYRSVSSDSVCGFWFVSKIPLPQGEGAAKRRVRESIFETTPIRIPSSGPSGHLLPEGEGLARYFFLIWAEHLRQSFYSVRSLVNSNDR